MAIRDTNSLKMAFETGKIPQQQDFHDLIDSAVVASSGITPLAPADTMAAPNGSKRYVATAAGTYSNLKLADGSAAPAITVTEADVAWSIVYLNYTQGSNSWAKTVSNIYDSTEVRFSTKNWLLGSFMDIITVTRGLATPIVYKGFPAVLLTASPDGTPFRALVSLSDVVAQYPRMAFMLNHWMIIDGGVGYRYGSTGTLGDLNVEDFQMSYRMIRGYLYYENDLVFEGYDEGSSLVLLDPFLTVDPYYEDEDEGDFE